MELLKKRKRKVLFNMTSHKKQKNKQDEFFKLTSPVYQKLNPLTRLTGLAKYGIL